MSRTVRWVGVGLLFSLGLGVDGMQAQQPVAAEPQAPSRTVQTPPELVPTLPVPRLVKFAGVFKDELGKPRTGVVGVTFAIYKEQEGGATRSSGEREDQRWWQRAGIPGWQRDEQCGDRGGRWDDHRSDGGDRAERRGHVGQCRAQQYWCALLQRSFRLTHTPSQVQDAFINGSGSPSLSVTCSEVRALDVTGYP